MSGVTDLDKRLRAKPDDFELKPYEAGKSEVWKHFSLIFEKVDGSPSTELKYFCTCNRCRKVYMYRATNGNSFGTKNLLDHVRLCKGPTSRRAVRRG